MALGRICGPFPRKVMVGNSCFYELAPAVPWFGPSLPITTTAMLRQQPILLVGPAPSRTATCTGPTRDTQVPLAHPLLALPASDWTGRLAWIANATRWSGQVTMSALINAFHSRNPAYWIGLQDVDSTQDIVRPATPFPG